MKPAATQISVKTEIRNRTPELHQLSSETRVLLAPGDMDADPRFSVTEPGKNRGLLRFPVPAKQYILTFTAKIRGRSGGGWSSQVESVLRPVRLANSPVGTRVLVLLPRAAEDSKDEPELAWTLCTVEPGGPSKKDVEKARQKVAYQARRYLEQSTRFDRI